MAAYTSNVGTFNWNDTAAWVGSVVPASGAGHTVTIVSNSTITVAANWDIGQNAPSPAGGGAGTAAITVTAAAPAGHLIIGVGITLICRGDLSASGGRVTLNAGAILEFDASLATTPLSQNYRLNMGTTSSVNGILTVSGTAGARCQIRSNVGGGNAYIRNQSSTNYNATVYYCDFTRIGTASLMAIELGYFTSDIQNCTFDTCGRIEMRQEQPTHTYKLVNVTMKNSLGSTCVTPSGGATAKTSGTREMTSCVFDKTVSFGWRDWTVSDNVFVSTTGSPVGGSGSAVWASFTNNILVQTSPGGGNSTLHGSISNCYCLADYPVNDSHYVQPAAIGIAMSVTGCVFDHSGTNPNGDCVLIPLPAVPTTFTIEHNIGLPNAATDSPGTLFSALGNANSSIIARHNTWFTGQQNCGVVGETYAGFPGMLIEFSNNLCWDTSARRFKLKDLTSTVTDIVSSANCHHNAGYLLLPGSNLKGYDNLDFSSGSPGANDVDGVDPDFVDPTRNIKTWDTSLGGPGTSAHAVAELAKKNEVGYNTAFNITALLAYVKAGFAPQAAALQAASDSVAPSNGWIGAQAGITAGGTGTLLLIGVG